MRIDPTTGWLDGARRVPSPFCDDRPPGAEIELVIVHGISLPPGEFGGPWIDALFSGSLPALLGQPRLHPYLRSIADLRVSAHLLLDRDGRPTQYVPFHRRAWHAGVSSWRGRERCNDFSVGVELEGTDTTAYTDTQYEALVEAITALAETYPAVRPDRVVGHSQVAPGRKTDPGPAFEWERLREPTGRSFTR